MTWFSRSHHRLDHSRAIDRTYLSSDATNAQAIAAVGG